MYPQRCAVKVVPLDRDIQHADVLLLEKEKQILQKARSELHQSTE